MKLNSSKRLTPQKTKGSTFKSYMNKGFALISTIMVMSLLLLLSIAMLSFSSVETTSSRLSNHQEVAEANARLALMTAIGQLHEYASKDSVATFSASILDQDSETSTIDGVLHPHWIAAKDNGTNVARRSPYGKDSSGDTLVDTRPNFSDFSDADAWLVSGINPDPTQDNNGELVPLVSEGSVINPLDKVSVPLVDVITSGQDGAYAYYISQTSDKVKIRASQHDSSTEDRRLAELSTSSRAAVELIEGFESFKGLTEAEKASVISDSNATLLPTIATDRSVFKQKFHAFTSHGYNVLSDPTRNKLKRDLSVIVTSPNSLVSSAYGPDIGENTPLLDLSSRNDVSPRLGALKGYADIGKNISSSGSLKPSAPTNLIALDKHGKVPDITKLNSHGAHPILASVTMMTRISYYRRALVYHIYPRIVLWNPYNVTLDASAYVLDFNLFVRDGFTAKKRDAKGIYTINVASKAYSTQTQYGGNPNNRPALYIEPTKFAPGESLVFCPKPTVNVIAGNSGRLTPRNSDISNNVMSAKIDPATMTNFHIPLQILNGVAQSDLPLQADHNQNWYWTEMMDWWEANEDNGLKIALYLADNGFSGNYQSAIQSLPLIQLLDTDNWLRGYNGRFNNGRWRANGLEEVQDYEATPFSSPLRRNHFGYRLAWYQEVNSGNVQSMPVSHVANYNLRASLVHRSTHDNLASTNTGPHWYHFGPYIQDGLQGISPTSPEYAAHIHQNGYRTNLFSRGTVTNPDMVYPVYELPKNGIISSIGQFRHAKLSEQIWTPGYSLLGSYPPLYLENLERTALDKSTYEQEWAAACAYLPSWLTQKNVTSDNIIHYDLGFEVNEALLDTYFVSGKDAAEKTALAASIDKQTFGNSRFIKNPFQKNVDPALLNDIYAAASQIMIDGGFNVNSTSIDAWKAVIGSLYDLEIKSSSGKSLSNEDKVPVLRFREPLKESVEIFNTESVDAWATYRALSELEIEQLAEEIVKVVKQRGPFFSVADFVNRRLMKTSSASGADPQKTGAIQAAIDSLNLNSNFADRAMPNSAFHDFGNMSSTTSKGVNRQYHLNYRPEKGAGLPAYLEQGDILQPIIDTLVVRSDTFVVRAYGESHGEDGQAKAKAWCEAIIQRTPTPIEPDSDNPHDPKPDSTFGRKYQMISFRWLSPSEV